MNVDISQNRHGGNACSVAAGKRVTHSANDQRTWVMKQAIRAGQNGVTVDELAMEATRVTGHEVTPNRISGRVSELKVSGDLIDTGRTRRTRTVAMAGVVVARQFSVLAAPARQETIW